jgi:ubiquinone/menaquinone biosynthesis C-methylase UbiE
MNNENLENDLKKWKVSDSFYKSLSAFEQEFLNLEFTGIRSPQNYKDRIRFLGLDNQEIVLDAGCGMGQWSLALASTCTKVFAIDKNEGRTRIAKELMKFNGVTNCEIANGGLEKLDFHDNTFDGIFCYSVIMFTNIPQTLNEFYRVLKPNGKLYIMTDLQGWQLVLLKRSIKSIPAIVLFWLRRILGYKSNIAFSKKWMVGQLQKANFTKIETDAEGCATFVESNKGKKSIPFYDSYFGKVQTLMEVVGVK